MKPSKNITTPRTLADCTWECGYPEAPIRAGDRGDAALIILGVCIFVVVVPLIYMGVL